MSEEPSTERRVRILDVAQDLFAEHGFEAVSMRDIASAAGVSLALLTYHFGTKDRLYREIFTRQKAVLEARVAHLRAVDPAAEDRLDLIVAAFVEPQMQLRETPAGLAFAQLLAREATDPSSERRGIIEELYDPMARQFIAALQEALPGVPADRIRWGYLFAVGAMSMSALDERVRRFGDEAGSTLAEKTELLKAFIRGGWSA
ncbi:TetR/AcrR family transcriptional regulator [Microbacterium sp. 2MCAF23]|uniref:TetR/AcrR family transcriptional regulator n=1 Tax=Microbacterium sp. 2MCAF23 TaxID=3232985 RepID=UPI003F9B2D11